MSIQSKKYLFIDRDGTLIVEPEDQQVDSMEKLEFMSGVIPALLKLQEAGYVLVMVSNQDGLGTESFPLEQFQKPHEWMMRIFSSQGIQFEAIRICPHHAQEGCECRKPRVGLLLDFLRQQSIDRDRSWVIGDRETDIQLAQNLGVRGLRFGQLECPDWETVVKTLLLQPRTAQVSRKTRETDITAMVDLDGSSTIQVKTHLGFFDHMLEQLAKHGGFGLQLIAKGDLHIDDHHTIEDTAIVLGQALRQALGDKLGIGRYGYLLPMDEALAQIAIDLSGRGYLVFEAHFQREKVGDFSVELVEHFFRSFADSLGASIHIQVKGNNAHHQIEAIFKGVGRALRPAFQKIDQALPSTKGIL